jgi:hypothetical protein
MVSAHPRIDPHELRPVRLRPVNARCGERQADLLSRPELRFGGNLRRCNSPLDEPQAVNEKPGAEVLAESGFASGFVVGAVVVGVVERDASPSSEHHASVENSTPEHARTSGLAFEPVDLASTVGWLGVRANFIASHFLAVCVTERSDVPGSGTEHGR